MLFKNRVGQSIQLLSPDILVLCHYHSLQHFHSLFVDTGLHQSVSHILLQLFQFELVVIYCLDVLALELRDLRGQLLHVLLP